MRPVCLLNEVVSIGGNQAWGLTYITQSKKWPLVSTIEAEVVCH